MKEQNALEQEALQAEIEMQQRKLELEERRREMQLKVIYAKVNAMEKTYAEADAATLSEVCFTSTPIDKLTVTPKHPPHCPPTSSKSEAPKITGQCSL